MEKKPLLHLIRKEKITSQIMDVFSHTDSIGFFLLFEGKNVVLIEKNKAIQVIDNLDINRTLRIFDIRGVVVHGLFPEFAKLICEIEKEITICWFVWGFDIYHLPEVRKGLYAEQTAKFIKGKTGVKGWVKQSTLLRRLYFLINRHEDYDRHIYASRKKITYFCTYIKEDFEFYSSHYITSAEFIYTPFCTLDHYLAGNSDLKVNRAARGVLIGNSNSPESNHVDVFSRLQSTNDINTTIIVPLSYGENDSYRRFVLEAGRRSLKDQFVPLLGFLDRGKYFEVLQSCSIAIFYHYRQQAMGNIIALLYMGMRIYLSPRNPAFHYCKRIGLRVFDFDTEFSIFKNRLLGAEDVQRNRDTLKKLFNDTEVQNNLNNLIRKIR